jgi:hypothetical protein
MLNQLFRAFLNLFKVTLPTSLTLEVGGIRCLSSPSRYHVVVIEHELVKGLHHEDMAKISKGLQWKVNALRSGTVHCYAKMLLAADIIKETQPQK